MQRLCFGITMLLAQSSVGPIIACDPIDICFTKFREIQSNGLKVERTHTHTHKQTQNVGLKNLCM